MKSPIDKSLKITSILQSECVSKFVLSVHKQIMLKIFIMINVSL